MSEVRRAAEFLRWGSMDHPAVDPAAELIARNRRLLALAEEGRATARDTIERAQDAVQSMMEIRLAWAQVRHLWRTRRDLP